MKATNIPPDSIWKNVLEWVGLGLLLVAILAWQSIFGYEVVTH